jgi:RNA polymerase sigma factor (TIGR02999 family)
MNSVTQILSAICDGDPSAASQLLPLVYDELRRLAEQKLARETPGQTLQPTALVHEAYLRLVGADADGSWENRGHFFAAAAEAMRRILIDRARHKRAAKHGGNLHQHNVENVQLAAREPDDDLLALDEALKRFAVQDPVKAQLVELRYFGGCTIEEAARVLGVSHATAERYWAYARAWLHREIRGENGSRLT